VWDSQAGAAVLVVDADATERDAVRGMLAPLNYRIAGADSTRAALRAVAHERFAVIVMATQRASLDGYETAKLIREQTGSELTPIIFLTSFGDDELETAAAYASGAVDFVFTPVLGAVLRAKVSTFMKLVMRSQQLRDSEVRARAVIENVAEGIITATEAGVIESVNPSALRQFGYDDEAEMIGQPFASIAGDSTGRRKDGSIFPMELGVSRMQIDGRTFTIGSVHDITGRSQRAERDRVAFEEAPIGSVITSRDGRIERVNQEMMGRTADQLIGLRLSELAHPEDHPAGAAALAALEERTSDTCRFESRYLRHGGRVIEATVAVSAIRDDHQDVIQLFTQIEDVTDARRTTRELEHAQFEMLARLAAAAELHDDDTGRHTHRVGNLSVKIAERLGLPGSVLELIQLAAALHDVGKIAIPDAVLAKRGRLTAEEFKHMKTHTTVGAEMLTGSAFELVALAEDIALTHHEKWDGSGYPVGLGRDEIPICGRIVAVADVFDALTHVRPYKPAWSVPDAMDQMRSQSGRHFDPAVLDAFFAAQQERMTV
jgi:PAS domain S-box-containing protein/putative nucleotidyltransferase with HDIG domain